MKKNYWLLALMIGIVLLSLVGCQQVSQEWARLTQRPTPLTVDTPLPTPTLSPTSAPTQAPTWTPAPPGALSPSALGTPTATPMVTATPTPVPLEASCAALWDIYPGGEKLVSEWLMWSATDPPSPDAHKTKLDAFVAAWTQYQERLEGVPVTFETRPIYEDMLAAAEKWRLGFTYASNMLATLNPCCADEALALEQEAQDLWNQAADRLASVCAFCASARPSPTATPTLTPTP